MGHALEPADRTLGFPLRLNETRATEVRGARFYVMWVAAQKITEIATASQIAMTPARNR